MKQYRNLLLTSLCLILGFVSLHYNMALLGLLFGAGTLVFFVLGLKDQQREAAVGNAEIKDTDEQLRRDLVEAQTLAVNSLSTASDELKSKVVELLVEAGKHLGSPATNGRQVYGSGFFINWNREGIALAAQAKKLIEEHAAQSRTQA